mmetsp:Transcript_56644/g.130181  ORF Transcript_56644/g.130181 Transcript_56644/m.130181 type:complete len:201 (-) Transcript_56644:79-681(-)
MLPRPRYRPLKVRNDPKLPCSSQPRSQGNLSKRSCSPLAVCRSGQIRSHQGIFVGRSAVLASSNHSHGARKAGSSCGDPAIGSGLVVTGHMAADRSKLLPHAFKLRMQQALRLRHSRHMIDNHTQGFMYWLAHGRRSGGEQCWKHPRGADSRTAIVPRRQMLRYLRTGGRVIVVINLNCQAFHWATVLRSVTQFGVACRS